MLGAYHPIVVTHKGSNMANAKKPRSKPKTVDMVFSLFNVPKRKYERIAAALADIGYGIPEWKIAQRGVNGFNGYIGPRTDWHAAAADELDSE